MEQLTQQQVVEVVVLDVVDQVVLEDQEVQGGGGHGAACRQGAGNAGSFDPPEGNPGASPTGGGGGIGGAARSSNGGVGLTLCTEFRGAPVTAVGGGGGGGTVDKVDLVVVHQDLLKKLLLQTDLLTLEVVVVQVQDNLHQIVEMVVMVDQE